MRSKLVFIFFSAIAAAAHGAPPSETTDATFVIEALAMDPTLASGGIAPSPIWSQPLIALQPARAARAVVLEKNGNVLALAVLGTVERTAEGKARIDTPPDRFAWCETGGFMHNIVPCYQDLDSDGKFEISRRGVLGTAEVLALSRVQEPKDIEPLAYRAATQTEFPRFHIGYRSCGTSRAHPFTFDKAPRFTTVVKRADSPQLVNVSRCIHVAKLIETRPDGAKLYEMDRFKVEVRTGDEKEFPTTLIEGITPGTLLAHTRSSWPLVDATEKPAEAELITGNTPYLVALGKPVLATQAKAGDEILSLEVRHGLTGHLVEDSESLVKKDTRRIPAGTPVYGVAMRSSAMPWMDAQVVWCLPPLASTAGEKRASCFGPLDSSSTLVESLASPYTARGVRPEGPLRNPPIVQPGPVDFGGPLVLIIKMAKADKKYIDLSWSLAPRGQWFEDSLRLRRAPDQNGLLLVGDLLLKIRDAGDQSFEITTTGELDADASLHLPIDAMSLIR
jgi:hypothetical protein